MDETWKKEDELKRLKAELATLDRRILLSLKSVDAQDGNTEGITELVPEQPAPQEARPLAPSADGADCTLSAGTSAGAAAPDSPAQGSGSVPGASPQAAAAAQEPATPAVHPMPAFLAAPPQHRPPKLAERPRTFSIRQAMDSLGNKDDPGSDQPEKEKPRPKLKL